MATSEAADREPVTSQTDPVTPLPRAQDRVRPVIESIRPELDGGRRPSKAAVGDLVCIEADAFVDGHSLVACEIRTRRDNDPWANLPMEPIGDDRFRGWLPVST